ncbi:hypothetical protein CUR178_04126 [Leishmania enriettii]|uniref:Uncharacterized protein n=1 Tax=Leishmania enriettii TaxID=5663 RepID=A0A836GY16_LEIEN|nr:hypothetical protein CUR178_04126 [Leishmania enriettii]
MQARPVSLGGALPKRRKRNSTRAVVPNPVNFSVQDRRLNTRLLNETQRRKAQLLGMTAHDVAHRLHRYTVQPSSLMDEGRLGGPGGGSALRVKLAADGDKTTPGAGAGAVNSTSSPSITHSGGRVRSPGRDAYSRWQAQRAQSESKKADGMAHLPMNSSTSPGECGEQAGAVPLVPPTESYEEWLSAGCPTGSWSALLQEEVYAPLEAERAFLSAKYDPKARLRS